MHGFSNAIGNSELMKRQRSGTDTIEFHILPKAPNGKGTYTHPRRYKIKTARAENQKDSYFPAASHQAILNKMNTKSDNIKGTNIDNENKPQQKHRLGTVSNKLPGGGEEGLKTVLRAHNLALGSAVVHEHTSYSVPVNDF